MEKSKLLFYHSKFIKKENEEIASDELTADAGGPYEGIAKTSLEFDASKSTSKQKISRGIDGILIMMALGIQHGLMNQQ